jgi:hypothetical protein
MGVLTENITAFVIRYPTCLQNPNLCLVEARAIIGTFCDPLGLKVLLEEDFG